MESPWKELGFIIFGPIFLVVLGSGWRGAYHFGVAKSVYEEISEYERVSLSLFGITASSSSCVAGATADISI